jgi:hypothetical protein
MVSTSHASGLLDVDAATFGEALGTRPMTFRHTLAGDPLFELDAIAARADDWPTAWIEHHVGDLPELLPDGDPPERLDVGPGDVIRDIAANRCWAVLWYTELVAEYRHLLDMCLDQVTSVVDRCDGPMGRRGANIFVAAPEAVSPAHFDRHHNLLLQIEGTKEVSIGVFDDPTVAQGQIEKHYSLSRNLERLPEQVTTYLLRPGDGLYIPPYAFHWVHGGPEPSVAFSCGFVGRSSERAQLVHTVNVRLRRLGLTPAPPGSPLRDGAKVALVRGRRRIEPLRRKVAALAGRG